MKDIIEKKANLPLTGDMMQSRSDQSATMFFRARRSKLISICKWTFMQSIFASGSSVSQSIMVLLSIKQTSRKFTNVKKSKLDYPLQLQCLKIVWTWNQWVPCRERLQVFWEIFSEKFFVYFEHKSRFAKTTFWLRNLLL